MAAATAALRVIREDGGIIPLKYAGRGDNVQPGFTFSNAPGGTVGFAIIFHDLDVALGGGSNMSSIGSFGTSRPL